MGNSVTMETPNPGDIIKVVYKLSFWGTVWAIVDSINGDDVWCYYLSPSTGELKRETLKRIAKRGVPSVENLQAVAQKLLEIYGQTMPDFEIVRDILREFEGKKVLYNDSKLNFKHFITFCKYGIGWEPDQIFSNIFIFIDKPSGNLKDDIRGTIGHIFFNQIRTLEIDPGDLIETFRIGFSHWAIVDSIENNTIWCYHVSGLVNNSNTSPNPLSTQAVLKREKLVVIADGDKYIINNQKLLALPLLKRFGQRMPDFEIVRGILNEYEGSTVNYKLFDLNCEYFATFCKYGIGWSKEVGLTSAIALHLSLIPSKDLLLIEIPYNSLEDGMRSTIRSKFLGETIENISVAE